MKGISLRIFDRNTLIHLRLPFSFFLLPIFIFGISQATAVDLTNTLIVFISLHIFIYPGSNIYNSYMDRDTGSIGGLKHPPPVTDKLFYASVLFDGVGLLLCLLINPFMLLLMLVYVGVSKAYSWRKIRLKRYGFIGWLVVMLFQGGYTFLLVNMAAQDDFFLDWFTSKNIQCMLLASLLIGGYYPLTQIYQHDEDSGRGDYTISYKLGINGTFIFTGALFLVACVVAWNYFNTFYNNRHFIIFVLSLMPVIVFYFYWFAKTFRDKALADYSHAMRITFISSCCMITCFSILWILNHN